MLSRLLPMLMDPNGELPCCAWLLIIGALLHYISVRHPLWMEKKKAVASERVVVGGDSRPLALRREHFQGMRACRTSDREGGKRWGDSMSNFSNFSNPTISSSASSASTTSFSRAASAPPSMDMDARQKSSASRRLSTCSCERCLSGRQLDSPPEIAAMGSLAADFEGARNSWGGIWVLRVWPADQAERTALAQGIEVPATSGEVEDIGSLTVTTAGGFVEHGEMLLCLGGQLKGGGGMPKHRKCMMLPGSSDDFSSGFFSNGVPVSTVSWSTIDTSPDEKPWAGSVTIFPCVANSSNKKKDAGTRVMGLVHAAPSVKGVGTEMWALEGRRVVAM